MPTAQPPTLRTLADLLSAADVVFNSAHDLSRVRIARVTDDSRDIGPATAFVARPGRQTDGRHYVAAAFAAGARAVITDASAAPVGDGIVVEVADPPAAHARLAAELSGLSAVQRAGGLRIAGVTGTNGKSTTVHLLHDILTRAGETPALIGTIHYIIGGEHRSAPWTTPPADRLADMLHVAHRHGARHAVMEVSSHALDQRRTDGLRFDVGVFTNLTGDHLDYHQDRSTYLAAKRRLFEGLPEDGLAVINQDDPAAEAMIRGCRARIVRVALDHAADYRAVDIDCAIDGTRFTVMAPDDRVETVQWPLVGRHNVANGLGALAAARALGIDWSTIQTALSAPRPIPGRLQAVHGGGRSFAVFVDYAHTDDALANVLQALRPLTAGRLWCVFGCGGDRDRSKRPRMAAVAERFADRVVVTSDNPRSEAPRAIADDILAGFSTTAHRAAAVELDRAAAIALAIGNAQPGDVVLIAGKGHEDYQLVADRRLHFDDVAVARQMLAGTGAGVGP